MRGLVSRPPEARIPCLPARPSKALGRVRRASPDPICPVQTPHAQGRTQVSLASREFSLMPMRACRTVGPIWVNTHHKPFLFRERSAFALRLFTQNSSHTRCQNRKATLRLRAARLSSLPLKRRVSRRVPMMGASGIDRCMRFLVVFISRGQQTDLGTRRDTRDASIAKLALLPRSTHR